MTEELAKLIDRIMKVDLTKEMDKEKELESVASRLKDDRRKLEVLERRDRYFFNCLCSDTNFENRDEFKTFMVCLPELAMMYRRIFVFINTLREFLVKNSVVGMYGLDNEALTKIIKCYVEDNSILKKRYNCPVTQLPKIAGLMANLIVKYRPIIPINTKNNPAIYINEIFAIYHALCICSDFTDGAELVAFEQTVECSLFYEDMRYLLNRNYTPECLIMVFKVLCQYQFRSFLNNDVDG